MMNVCQTTEDFELLPSQLKLVIAGVTFFYARLVLCYVASCLSVIALRELNNKVTIQVSGMGLVNDGMTCQHLTAQLLIGAVSQFTPSNAVALATLIKQKPQYAPDKYGLEVAMFSFLDRVYWGLNVDDQTKKFKFTDMFK